MLRTVAARFLLLLMALSGAAQAAFAEKRVALVIGNSKYANALALDNPVRDAKAVAEALRAAGFSDVTEGYDLTKPQFDAALKKFGDAASSADWALVFYAGHGIGVGGETYLLPVDVVLARAEHVDYEAVALSRARAAASGAKALRLVILDSCRNNPFVARMKADGGKRAVSRGLARPPEPEGGELIAYATRENDVADDGEGSHSPFTAAFLQHVQEPGLEVGFLFRKIRASVLKNTGGAQDPATYGSLSDTPLFFNARVGETKAGEEAALKDRLARLEAELQKAQQRNEPGEDVAALKERLARLEAQQNSPGRPDLQKKQVAAVTPAKPAPPAEDGCDGLLVSVGLSNERPCVKPGSSRSFKDCPDCPEMVAVPAGSFTMGSPENEPERTSYEGPQHKVTIEKPFAVGKFAVTFAEWDACVAGGGCRGYKPKDEGWGRGNRPVINVSWSDAKAYAEWLSKKTGKSYRLLTEAEREYVTRAGSATPFWWGSSISTEQANYNGYTYNGGATGQVRGRTVPVNSFKPNPWGLYQVHGNVWEWVEDCWNDSYDGAPTDGSAPTSGDCGRRVFRGGSWSNFPRNLRAAQRNWDLTGSRSDVLGFRVARTLTP